MPPVVGPLSGSTSSRNVSPVFWFVTSWRVFAGDPICNRDVSDGVKVPGALAPRPEGTPEDVLRAQDIPDGTWLNLCAAASGTLEDWFTLLSL